jgi:hypothetical protein|tara:strand:+ start:2117 stop:2329 length:213 start_codon:yes stop_codon:yes gene_type:complete
MKKETNIDYITKRFYNYTEWKKEVVFHQSHLKRLLAIRDKNLFLQLKCLLEEQEKGFLDVEVDDNFLTDK